MGKFIDLWDRKKDGDNRGRRSFLRCVIVSSILCLLFLLFKKDNLLRWVEAGIQIHDQKKEIERIENEIRKVGSHAEMLETDKDSLEKYARENYNFCAPDEDQYIVK